MVIGTIQVGMLFSWSRNFDVDKDENVLKIIYYPTDSTELHIQPTEQSVNKLKLIRDSIKAIMNAEVTLEGVILERWEKQMVEYPSYTKEEWVRGT